MFLCGEEFAAVDGGMSYDDVQAAVGESSRIVSDPPRILDMELARQHIEICAACAREYGFSAGTLGTIKMKLRRIDVAPDLVDRISLVISEAHARDEGIAS